MKFILPSGNEYETSIDNWATGKIDIGDRRSRREIQNLAAAAVVKCFQEELAEKN